MKPAMAPLLLFEDLGTVASMAMLSVREQKTLYPTIPPVYLHLVIPGMKPICTELVQWLMIPRLPLVSLVL